MKTILIIEDDTDILDMMAYIVEDDGFNVVSAPDKKPLDMLSEINPQLILMDNRLADGFGSDYCKKIKLDPATAHIPVILISATNGLAEMAKESLADAYLDKPFDLEALLVLVNKYIL